MVTWSLFGHFVLIFGDHETFGPWDQCDVADWVLVGMTVCWVCRHCEEGSARRGNLIPPNVIARALARGNLQLGNRRSPRRFAPLDDGVCIPHETYQTPETLRPKRGFGQRLIQSSLWSLGSFRSPCPQKQNKGLPSRTTPIATPYEHYESEYVFLCCLVSALGRSRAQEILNWCVITQ